MLEIFVGIHALLALSAVCIGGSWLFYQPSYKLSILRLMLVSCVLSPLAVHWLQPWTEPFLAPVFSLDSESGFGIPLGESSQEDLPPSPVIPPIAQGTTLLLVCGYLLGILFLLGAGYQGRRVLRDWMKLRRIVRSAIPYRALGRVSIQISEACGIPFSLRIFGRAYIVLPLSLLDSPSNMKMAIAHEGQHHRQGDCLWTYFLEFLRVVFWGNPGMERWHRVLGDVQEFSCDEALVGHQMVSAHDYGHCLFKVAQTVSHYAQTNPRKFACAVGMAWNSGTEKHSSITRRICMLSQYKCRVSSRVASFLAVAAILVPLCTAYAAKGSLSPVQGLDTASLDPELQQIAEAEITAAVKQYGATSGAIALADPRTGRIQAFAESGASLKGGESWRTRVFAPASTIKPFIAAVAIDAGVTSASQRYDCRDPYEVRGTFFRNSEPQPQNLSMTEAVEKSVNVCMIKVAQDISSTQLRKTLARFGFDTQSSWKSEGSDALQVANLALGTHLPMTMGGLIQAYAMLAHGGRPFTPKAEPAVSASTADAVTRMLTEAVAHGTGNQAALSGIRVAGKTATLVPEGTGTRLAIFGGYAPAEAPRFVALVIMEGGKDAEGGTSGGRLAAPVFHAVVGKSLAQVGR